MISLLGIYPGSVVKNLPVNAGCQCLIPGSGKSPGEGNGNPLQYSCLGNPTDRGSWWVTVHGVTKGSDSIEMTKQQQQVKVKGSNHWCCSPNISMIASHFTDSLMFRTFKEANVRSHVQARKLVHVTGVHCHVCASSTSNCGFIYFTV